jgi:hypothetical protein
MMILGVSFQGMVMRAVVAERTRHAIEILEYFEQPLASAVPSNDELQAALQNIVDETHVADVAMVLNVPDVLITRLPGQERLHHRERVRSGRLLVENQGFGTGARPKMPTTSDGSVYVAVARRERIDVLDRIVRGAGGRLRWLDHEAYAWAAILPESVQAIVVADAYGAKLIIGGTETVEIGTYTPVEFAATAMVEESTESRISRAVLEEVIAAAKANFADVETIALDDVTDQYRQALTRVLPNTIALVPFTLEIAPERTPWALACGVALRALQLEERRLHINFAESRSLAGEVGMRLSRHLSTVDIGTLAAGAVIAAGLIAWRSETTHDLLHKALALETRVLTAKQRASAIDEDLAKVARARAVLERVETTQRSGPVVARQIAAIVDRMDPRTSATSLGAQSTGWTLTGHAEDADQVARLMLAVQSSGFDSSLTSTEQQGARLAYSLALDPVPSPPTTGPRAAAP